MAYVNVAEWKPDQVTDWLKGLDNCVLPYVQHFLNNRVNGQQLLGLCPSDLEHLGVLKIGHQEVILEGVEHLRNIHYELDRENLQLLAMRLSCLAHSLHNELCHSHIDSQRLSTHVLADMGNIVTAVKPLIAWLDRPGFTSQDEYRTTRSEVLKLALRMATCGQRDRFAEAPVADMKDASAKLAKLADSVVQEMTDPLILQPASLDLATVKKRSSDDLGFYIVPSFRGVHQISDLKLNSPAHQCNKIEPGDEIIQINYQTVVGWDVKQVMHLFAESPTEVLLTLKKRPRHTKVYGQIYVKPYRLPSKKRAIQHGFAPRPEHLTRLQLRLPLQSLKLPTTNKIENQRARDSSSSDEEVTVQHKLPLPSKPVHRRATITGASPLSKRPPFDIHELWHDLKLEKESCSKQSTTSVVDFEDRLSSVDNSLKMEDNLETLTIKQKIEMFSREKPEKPKILPKKIKEIEKMVEKSLEVEIEEKRAEIQNIQVNEIESQESVEEHGKVVETINRHLLVDVFCDEPYYDTSCNSLPNQKKKSRSPMPDSELSRTISRVTDDDYLNNKELSSSSLSLAFSKPHIYTKNDLRQKTSPDKSLSSDNIRIDKRYKDSNIQYENTRDVYNSLQDRRRNRDDCSERQSQERQTLPKTGKINIPPVPPPRPSLSKPPNACYRAIMAAKSLGKASPKTQRKKNPLLTKRRKVAVKDFPSIECEGWLLQRSRNGSSTWVKRWCVIHSNTLYTFKAKESLSAETMVCLPGFTVSPAEEVKSRPFAFKVYHTGTMFYFAAETNFELNVWLDAISTATLEPNPNTQEVLYSENEEEVHFAKLGAPPTPAPRPQQTTSSSETSKMFGSLKKLGRARVSSENSGSSLDRKCLRILGTGPMPVPTAQYRSYRRVHNNAPSSSNSNVTKEVQEHQKLPPEMADYRLASLTAKTTPPVPRRSRGMERPLISAPILNHPLPDESRRLNTMNYTNDEALLNSLRNERKKVKKSQGTSRQESDCLEYPPVFEPGTYTLDALAHLPRSFKNRNLK